MSTAGTTIDVSSSQSSDGSVSSTFWQDRCPSRTPRRLRRLGRHWNRLGESPATPRQVLPETSREETKEKEINPPILPIHSDNEK